jgi:N-carbamoyl-L-amino-acid hydrolase
VSVAERLAGLDGIGARPDGIWRLAWTPEDAQCRTWFHAQAEQLGLSVQIDPAGNLWACPQTPAPWPGLGSHLDSVRGGGSFDGPLGVACAFEVAAQADQPIAVIDFADEEGARFNTPTFGSKALTGRLDLPGVLARRDDDGVLLADAMRDAGVDPARLSEAPSWLEKLSSFVEVHIDQSRELAEAGAAIGVVSSLASRLRLELDVRGRADHAGTTPPADRRDALLAGARIIVAAAELGADFDRLTITTSRILVAPNANTTIASHVRLWIDARAPRPETIEMWLERLRQRMAISPDVDTDLAIASRSDGQDFSPELRGLLKHAGEEVIGGTPPEVVCFAGHDAGVLAARIPAAMVLVRNPTGISHSPEEQVDLRDAEAAVGAVRRALGQAG